MVYQRSLISSTYVKNYSEKAAIVPFAYLSINREILQALGTRFTCVRLISTMGAHRQRYDLCGQMVNDN